MLRILYTNADQFLNKHNLHSTQTIGMQSPSPHNYITEMLSKYNSSISSALFVLPCRIFSLYINFDHPPSPLIYLESEYLSLGGCMLACQVFLNSPDFEDQIWARI